MTVDPAPPRSAKSDPRLHRRDGPPRPPLDLRLAAAAAAGWIAVLLLTPLGGTAALVVGVVGAVTLLAAAGLARRPHAASPPVAPPPPSSGSRPIDRASPVRRRVPGGVVGVVGLIGAGLAVVLLPLAVRLGAVERSPFAAVAGGGARVDLVVGEVRRIAGGGVSPAPRVLVDATVTAVQRRGEQVPVTARVVLFAPADGWLGLLPGQRVRVDAGVRPADGDPWRVAVLSVRGPPERLGSPPSLQRWAAHVRAALVEACAGLPDGPRGLLPGLVVGDTSRLDPVLEAHFRAAGLTHLVAVSGVNDA